MAWLGPNADAIVKILAARGADLNAPAVATWHREAPLHWAASSDDVALIEALLDAGADIEREGSSIDGGPPLSSAVGYGQWAAARGLVARGARTELWHEAALGLLEEVKRRLEADPSLRGEELSGPFWNACHGGQLATAQYLLSHGAKSRLARALDRANAARYRREGSAARCCHLVAGQGCEAGGESGLR